MSRSILRFVLAIGFLAVAAGIGLARRSPANGYEVSIYAATPAAVWVALGVALAIAVGITLSSRGRSRALGIALGGTVVTTIVSLPVIRGYRYLGYGDALTHLGWARDITAGSMLPHDLFYPGLHGTASLLHVTGGAPLERSILLTVVLLFLPFLLFVPLVVRDVSGDATAVGFAAVASWLVLPINNVSTHMGAHTNTNALFLVPVAIFAFVAYLRRRSDLETLPFGISPYAVVLLLAGVGLLLVHPQQMFNVVILFGAICAVQFLARRRYDDHPMSRHSSAFALTGLLGLAFAVWVASRETFRRAVAGTAYGLLTGEIGGDDEVAQREASLTDIGASIEELFVVMFSVAAVIGVLVGLFILATWLGRTSVDRETKSFVNYFALALIPLTGLFVVYFLGTETMAFRQIGFIYVVVTILAGIALARGVGWLGGLITRPAATAVAATVLGACLVLSLATVFASPLIFSPTQHVSEPTMSGYESALEHGDGETAYAGFGFPITRYAHGIDGVSATADASHLGSGDGYVDGEQFEAGEYGDGYGGEDYYFLVSSWDQQREIGVYEGLRHSEASLEGVDGYPGANKVVSNDDFRMYTVSGSE